VSLAFALIENRVTDRMRTVGVLHPNFPRAGAPAHVRGL
jgi:hypothetical protein